MKTLTFFMVILILTGCITREQKLKIYTNRVKFYRPEKQKVLYKAEPVDELSALYVPETMAAENKMNIERLRELTEYNKKSLYSQKKN